MTDPAEKKRRYQKKWTRADLDDLEATWPQGDVKELCARLGRNYKTVSRRASLLGLRRDPDVVAQTHINSLRNKAREEEFGERRVLITTADRRTMVDRAIAHRTPLEVAWCA